MSNTKTEWKKLDDIHLVNFSNGIISGAEWYSKHKNTETGGIVRSILRTHRVAKARTLAKRAIARMKRS